MKAFSESNAMFNLRSWIGTRLSITTLCVIIEQVQSPENLLCHLLSKPSKPAVTFGALEVLTSFAIRHLQVFAELALLSY